MPIRKEELSVGEVYHVFSRSIVKYRIFGSEQDCQRMLMTMKYYKQMNPGLKLSKFLQYRDWDELINDDSLVDIIAFCIMPTHIHLILKQLEEEGISTFIRKILNSYARYFNTKYDRKGPLYDGRFKHVIVDSTEQLYHLTRYIHLNPVTSGLVDSPEEWHASSYHEYISRNSNQGLCTYDDILEVDPEEYRNFVMSRMEYQKELGAIKHMLIE